MKSQKHLTNRCSQPLTAPMSSFHVPSTPNFGANHISPAVAYLRLVRLDEDVTMNEQTQTSIEADLLQANLAGIMSGVSKGACYFLVCESV